MESQHNPNNSLDETNNNQNNQQNNSISDDINNAQNNNDNDSNYNDNTAMDNIISSNNSNNGENSNIQIQTSITHTKDSNSIYKDLITSINKTPVKHRSIRTPEPKIKQASNDDELNSIPCLEQLKFEDKKYNLFVLYPQNYEESIHDTEEKCFIKFVQKFKFCSNRSIFDQHDIINRSHSLEVKSKALDEPKIEIRRTKTTEIIKTIKLKHTDQIYISHFYREKPLKYDCKTLGEKISFFMKNTNISLADFHGFILYDLKNNFFPTVLTERPINGPLSSLFKNFVSFSAEKKFILIFGIINGLDFIHSAGFIHLNLNTETVYIDDTFRPKICDYVFIQPITAYEEVINDKKVYKYKIDPISGQSVFQNMKYVAPEILKGEKFDQLSDIFSLGLIIFFILAEKEAEFDDDGNITNYPDTFPPSNLWHILIDNCISKEMEKRESAQKILKELLNDDQKMHEYIDSISNTKIEISRETYINLLLIKTDLKAKFSIFHRMIPNVDELDKMTRLIISAAENEDNESLMEVADYFMNGKKNIHKDENWAFFIYHHVATKKDSECEIYDKYILDAKFKSAELNLKGIGTRQNLRLAKCFLIKIKNDPRYKDDPRYKEIDSKIEDIDFRLTNIIVKNIQNLNRDRLKRLFRSANYEIEIHDVHKEGTNEIDKEKVRITFKKQSDFEKFEKSKETFRLSNRDPIQFEFFKKSLNESHRFESLAKDLHYFELEDFYSGKERNELKKLGEEGASGQTFLVINKNTKKEYAAKVFKKTFNNESIALFKREVIIPTKLDHIAILKYVGFNEHSIESYYNFHTLKKNVQTSILNGLYPTLFMDYIPNGTLEDAIKKKPNWWNQTTKLKAIFGIANALAYMFAHNIIHRDLKTLNILINKDYEVLIGDFGLARQIVSGEKNDVTKKIGSFHYMAPELYISDIHLNYTYEVDSYAFGVILFKILSDCEDNLVYPKEVNNFESYLRNKLDDFKRKPPKGTHNLFVSIINACWNVSIKERPDPPTIYCELLDAIAKNEKLMPDADMDKVADYINRLPIIQLD